MTDVFEALARDHRDAEHLFDRYDETADDSDAREMLHRAPFRRSLAIQRLRHSFRGPVIPDAFWDHGPTETEDVFKYWHSFSLLRTKTSMKILLINIAQK